MSSHCSIFPEYFQHIDSLQGEEGQVVLRVHHGRDVLHHRRHGVLQVQHSSHGGLQEEEEIFPHWPNSRDWEGDCPINTRLQFYRGRCLRQGPQRPQISGLLADNYIVGCDSLCLFYLFWCRTYTSYTYTATQTVASVACTPSNGWTIDECGKWSETGDRGLHTVIGYKLLRLIVFMIINILQSMRLCLSKVKMYLSV